MSQPTNQPADPTILRGDGSYGFTARIVGNDIVVAGVGATWFGGAHDPMDNGQTASGVSTKRHPDFLGCALPMDGFKLTSGSPLPTLPYIHTTVEVTRPGVGKSVRVLPIDLGPAKPPHAHAAIDLTVAAFQALGGDLRTGRIAVEYRIIDGALHLPANVHIDAIAAARKVSGGKGAAVASGGTAAAALLAVPLSLAMGIVGFPLIAEANVSADTLRWIGGLVGFLAIVKLVLGIVVDGKKLRAVEKPIPGMPNPLVVTQQPMFATLEVVNKVDEELKKGLATLDKYVHESIHNQAKEIQGVALLIKASDEEHRDATADINRQGEERISKVHERLNAIDRSIGALTQSSATTDALAAEVRQTLNVILQRLPRQGGRA